MQKYINGTFTEDGSSSEIAVKKTATVFVGSSGGQDFGGGTLEVDVKGPDGLWYSTDNATAEATILNLEMPNPGVVRLTLAGSSSPDLDYAIQSDYSDLE